MQQKKAAVTGGVHPLCVDLDGTVINSDMLWESFIRLIKKNIFYIFLVPFWLFRGKAPLKREIAQRVTLDVTQLPYNETVIGYLQKEKAAGRELILATASDAILANLLAEHLGCFTKVIASDGVTNYGGSNKAQALVDLYGEKNFSYVGNSRVDLKVWKYSATAIPVSSDRLLLEKVENITTIEDIIPQNIKISFASIVRALRVHQWVKNLLIFIPLLLAHQYLDSERLITTVLAFISFCLCASGVYILNDLMDIDADRSHPIKKSRPFASGNLAIIWGLLGLPALIIIASVIALFVAVEYFYIFLIYFLLTSAYSFKFKSIVLLDVFVLAGLYSLRILAGTFASNVEISFWLLVFSMFIFFSLALVKRYSELHNLKLNNETNKTIGRDYVTADQEMLSSLGATSGYIAVLVMALYIQSPAQTSLYTQPEWLWLVFPALLYWVSRMWLIAHRGKMNEDPVLFAVRDMPSYIVALVCVFGIIMAL